MTLGNFLYLVLLVPFAEPLELPSFVKLCHKSEPDITKCFINSFNELLPRLKKGIPELNLPPADPIPFGNISVSSNSRSTSLDINLKSGVLRHLSELEILDSDVDLSVPRWYFKMVFPFIQMDTKYSVKGKVLLFELNTEGSGQFNLTDLTIAADWFATFYQKNGKRHAKFDRCDMKMDVKKISAYLENLFPNNEALTKTVNAAINENMDQLIGEFKPIIMETVCKVSAGFINQVYDVYPFDQLYPS